MLGGTILVLFLELIFVALVVVELLILAFLSGFLLSLGSIAKPSSRSLLLTHSTVLRLTGITKAGVSSGHVELRSLLLSVLGLGAAVGSISGVEVPLIELNVLHFHGVASSLGLVLEHNGRRSTSGFDSVGADITFVHFRNVDVLSHIDIVGEVDLGGLSALVLWLRAESHGEVLISIRGRATPCGIVHLSAGLILAASGLDLSVRIELLGIVSNEAEVPSTFDALAAFMVGIPGLSRSCG